MTEKKTPPRENLSRSVSFTFTRGANENGDGLTFEGYGAVFNSPTRIDSWEGTFDEQIAPGAFRKSLRERTPKFQFDHGHHPLIGSIPIGAISDIHEDDRGLYVQARLGQHILIDLIREAIASGAIDGMSFRFSVVRDEWHDRDGKLVKPEEVDQILYRDPDNRGPLLRTLKEVKIAEVGPVVWPAYADTTAAVRSADVVEIDRTRLQEPEQRRLLAELLLRADAVDHAPEAGESEPQDTTEEVAVEHSDEDTDAPRPTEQAGEHEPEPETEQEDSTPPEDRNADDDLFAAALAEVRNAMELNPPLKGL
ncbi:HK97 family phage prohead protease [Mycobacteroides abscessus]|uniref:HK97 family phage prohead protease n=2 Tax=Mycobacteroides abscessus TaxID=36809 RepID=UPI000D3EC0CD|nr:HK97 family phage prohead protease [Mycobacteroides abscessus]PVB26366.1 HK97 family phage prohead protease [Mycobacteroides abscessus]